MKNERIFLLLLTMCGLSFLSACTDVGSKRVDLPTDIRAITDPFVAAIKRGDAPKAEQYLSSNVQDLPKIRFTEAQKMLAASPELRPVFVQSKPKSFMGPKDNEYTVVYAAKQKSRWKTVQMRLVALDGEPYEIEYWHAKDEAELPLMLRNADLMTKTLIYGGAFMLALLGIFTAGLIWFFRSRKNTTPADGRRVATISRSLE